MASSYDRHHTDIPSVVKYIVPGRWLGVFEIPSGNGAGERFVEIVKCSQLSGNEIRGKITNENTGEKYSFAGRVVFDELVSHYWSNDKSKDIGTFKFTVVSKADVLQGPLTLYNSISKLTQSGIQYTWYRYPRWLAKTFKPVRAARSSIEGSGLFANSRFMGGEKFGKLGLGRLASQGKHTISLNGQHHRIVKKPWRFLNHSCEPNARLEFQGNSTVLVALQEILPQTEITFDYKSLNETITDHFMCRCPKCGRTGKPVTV